MDGEQIGEPGAAGKRHRRRVPRLTVSSIFPGMPRSALWWAGTPHTRFWAAISLPGEDRPRPFPGGRALSEDAPCPLPT